MTYKELKKIAQPHIREGDNLPSNSFFLLNQLHIPFANEIQCESDYQGKMNPLYDTPAFLAIKNNGERMLYYKTSTRYWNFYIFHEIAHYLLNHEANTTQNEIDANLLACILIAPIKNLPKTIRSARDVSAVCNIPIDRAEEYWQHIKWDLPPTNQKKKLITFSVACVTLIFVIFSICLFVGNKSANNTTTMSTAPSELQLTEIITPQSQIVITASGHKYHMPNCSYVANKTNTTSCTLDYAISHGYEPCSKCFGNK